MYLLHRFVKRASVLVAMLVLALASASIAGKWNGSSGPKGSVTGANGELSRLLQQDPNAASNLGSTSLMQIAGQLLDANELAKRSLGASWDQLTPERQQELASILGGVIGRNYIKQQFADLNSTVVYGDETIDGDDAQLTAQVQGTGARSVTYRLHKAGPVWKVYDVSSGSTSLLSTYRKLFQSAYGQGNYAALLQRLKQLQATGK